MSGLTPLKNVLRESLLDLGLYHKVNDLRFRNDPRNESQKQFYARVIKPEDLVFDVGANVGQRSAIFAQLAKTVIAIEPQPNCVRHLRSRFRFNRRVIIQEVALGEQDGAATMWQSNSSGISSMSRRFIDTMGSGVFSGEKWDKEITVPVKTLDDLINTFGLPAFMKIDVEGYELKVLQGLTAPVPLISFEYSPEMIDEARNCAQRLQQISVDYRYNYCLGENLEFVLDSHVDFETFINRTLPEICTHNTFGDVYATIAPGREKYSDD
jgi:FkbM family methyltransferase